MDWNGLTIFKTQMLLPKKIHVKPQLQLSL